MNYTQVSITVKQPEVSDILIALLSEDGFEGFEQKEDALVGFIPSNIFNVEVLANILAPFNLTFSLVNIPKTNWNKKWEENFNPVVIDDFCTIRAHFHKMHVTTPYEIVVTPKMSFGTGHHATTQLMVSMMRQLDFDRKSVLDFGTGTGILAILARKLGAERVVAIDNEDWACENALENVERNGVGSVEVHYGSLEMTAERTFDLILANINRNILLQYMGDLYSICKKGGTVLMSGLLEEDGPGVLEAARTYGFQLKTQESRSNWLALCLER
jgi:ribosomal protein L11 methyltransferase